MKTRSLFFALLAGAEVVQLYISDTEASVARPAKELKGFEKVYLKPGEFHALLGSSSADIRADIPFRYEK